MLSSLNVIVVSIPVVVSFPVIPILFIVSLLLITSLLVIPQISKGTIWPLGAYPAPIHGRRLEFEVEIIPFP